MEDYENENKNIRRNRILVRQNKHIKTFKKIILRKGDFG